MTRARSREAHEAADAAARFQDAAERARFVAAAAIANGTNAEAIVELERSTGTEVVETALGAVALFGEAVGVERGAAVGPCVPTAICAESTLDPDRKALQALSSEATMHVRTVALAIESIKRTGCPEAARSLGHVRTFLAIVSGVTGQIAEALELEEQRAAD